MRYLFLAIIIHLIIFLPIPWDKKEVPLGVKQKKTQISFNYSEEKKMIETEQKPIEAPPIAQKLLKPQVKKPKPIRRFKKVSPKIKKTVVKKVQKVKDLSEKLLSKPKVFSKARSKNKIRPTYPWRARQRGFEGISKIEAIINSKGRVTKARLIKSSGHKVLDDAALKEVKKALFYPAKKNGIPIASRKKLNISFKLND